MLRAHSFVPAPAVGRRPLADSVVLSFEDRRRRRGTVTTLGGLEILVDLAEAPALGHGDAYELEDGRLVEIVAEAEALLEVKGRDATHLVRLAWHLGNRHLETEIGGKWLRIRRDHVIAAMLTGLGARVVEIEGPFQPEGGAYAHGGEDHGHDHGHGHDHHAHEHHHHDHDDHDDHDHDHDHHEHHGHEPHSHDRAVPPDPKQTGPSDERRDRMNDAPQYR
jgi:urease accessory protein